MSSTHVALKLQAFMYNTESLLCIASVSTWLMPQLLLAGLGANHGQLHQDS